MSNPCAFFDVDTRIADERDRLVIGPRAEPIRPQLERLLAFAAQRGVPVVATTCVQTKPIARAIGNGPTYVRVDDGRPDAMAQAAGAKAIFIERRSCGDGDANVTACVFDVFHANSQATECIRRVDARRWAIFGVSLAYCLRAACEGLCRLGLDVTLLTDAVVPAGRAYCRSDQEVLADLAAASARLATTEAFLESLDHA